MLLGYDLHRFGPAPEFFIQPLNDITGPSRNPFFFGEIKHLRQDDEARLADLVKTRGNITNIAEAEIRLGQLYDQVMDNLNHATHEIKRLAYDALDIKVYASPDKLEIRGVIPLELTLPTIEQTSALRHGRNYRCRRV